MSLRLRIILIYVLLVVASFSCVIYLILSDVRTRYLEAVEESMVETSELMSAMLAQQALPHALQLDKIHAAMAAVAQRTFSAQIYDLSKRQVDLRIYVTDAKGILLYDSAGETRPGADFSQWRDVYLTLRGQYGARSTRTDPQDPASSVIYVASPIVRNGQVLGVVSVGKPTNSISFLIAIAQNRFLLSLALVGITAIALSIVLSAWITRPLNKLIAHVHAARQGAAEPLPSLGSSEIGELATELTEMRTKLEGKKYIEDYVQSLTHEMKSPLTGIKGAGEILRDHVTDARAAKFLGNIDTEVDRLQSLVERMLHLSRLENVRAVNKTRIPAAAFFESLQESFRSQLAGKAMRLAIAAPDLAALEGDELLLRQALGNLIANAIDFSPPGSVITLAAAPQGRNLVITVTDQGCGIPDFAMLKVFDKFFSLNRPDSGKKSTGLGLPFVKEVLSLHGGTIELNNTGAGLQARVTLPL